MVGVVLDLGMARLLRDFWTAEVAGNALTGVGAGYAMFKYMAHRARVTQQRAGQIAYLNHHIRNAMEAVVLSHYTVDDVRRLDMMREASERIDTALKRFTTDDTVSLERLADPPPKSRKARNGK